MATDTPPPAQHPKIELAPSAYAGAARIMRRAQARIEREKVEALTTTH